MIEGWIAFLTGLAGSGHCLGMCGGIATAVSLHDSGPQVRGRLLFNLCYNLGRVSTYGLLGVAAGLAGSAFNALAVREASLWFFAVANLVVLFTGVVSLLGTAVSWSITVGTGASSGMLKPLRKVLTAPRYPRAFCSGALLGFLPCGLVYAVLVAAAESGSARRGMVIMGALGAGTMPSLLLVGAIPALVKLQQSRMMRSAVGFGLIFLGGAGLCRLVGKLGYVPLFPLW
jgi:sulfite exporter TauE/SafE